MSAAPRIALVDYGMGNRRSVFKALQRSGARVQATAAPDALRAADGLVLPGVGAFPRAAANLRERGLDELLVELARGGKPLLGICLGMQLLFERSAELGGARGLGLLAGEVEPLDARGGRLPQIGWNEVRWERPSPLLAGLPDPCAFYHVHGFAPRPADADDVLGTATYGERFVSAVQRGRILGVQFHPEKSSTHGLALIAAFCESCAPAEVAA